MKDWLLSKGIRLAWDMRFKKVYGDLLDLQLDSRAKTLKAEFLLKGETAPICLDCDYLLTTESEVTNFKILRVNRCSREWLETLLNNLATQHLLTFPLPLSILKNLL
jgi:hypothetical protein